MTPLPDRMRAWTVTRYGGPDVLALESLPLPALGARDVLIKIEATTVNSGDRRIRAFDLPPGMRLIGRLALGLAGPRRKVLGTEATGTVVAIGADVTAFKVGDPVIAFAGMRMGAHADYISVPTTGALAHRPPGMTTETAAALAFGGTTALDFLRRASLRAGERLLVIGAAGTVGSAFVQIGKAKGAHVTALASPQMLPVLQSIGADDVIDRHVTPVTALTGRYDIIADTAAALTFRGALPLLAEGGRYLAIAGGLADWIARPTDGKRSIAGPAAERAEDLAELVRLAVSGRFTPLIDSSFDFSNLPAAHARADTGRKHGSVVVRVERD